MVHRLLQALALVVVFAGNANTTQAQSGGVYTVVAHAIGPAGLISGGAYGMPASMTSPEAGIVSGGVYHLDGGFWLGTSVFAVGTPVSSSTRLSFSTPIPNPSGNVTQLSFVLPADGPVRLDVYSVDGRRIETIVDGVLARGPHQLSWSGADRSGVPVASGIYFLRLRAVGQQLTQRVVRVRP